MTGDAALITSLTANILRDGYALTGALLDPAVLSAVEAELVAADAFRFDADSNRVPVLDRCPLLRQLCDSAQVGALLEALDTPDLRPRSAFVLDKTSTNNWKLPWHQDLYISVNERLDIAGYTDWSVQAGVVQVRPPDEVLRSMLAMRLNFNDCTVENGAINVIPGSHRLGRALDPESVALGATTVCCETPRHTVMFMKPLLVHDSPPSSNERSRRTAVVEFGPPLPSGLTWHRG